GEFCTLIGPSGCGKSTLLGILGGLVHPDGGHVRVDGLPVTGPDPRRVATVFQDPGLFPWRTALANVEFGLELGGVDAQRRRAIATGLLGPLGLKGFAGKYPRELSGGMKQRVAIGRALAIDTKILLMDEPFGALDEQTRVLMGEWLLDIWRRTRKTVIFVTHSLHEALFLSTRIAVMTARPGRIKSVLDVPPSDVLPALRDLLFLRSYPDLPANVLLTVREIAMAYALAVVAGLACGFALGFNRLIGRAWGPMIAALYAVPAVVWYPSLMLFFGLDAASKIAFGFLLGFFPVTLAVLAGIRQVNPHLVTVARAY